jgi:hypothetical protein
MRKYFLGNLMKEEFFILEKLPAECSALIGLQPIFKIFPGVSIVAT